MNAVASTPDDAQEVEVWWGGCAAVSMLPSLILCFALTGAIFSLAWAFLERGYVQLAVLGGAGLVWLVQCWRFVYRYFGSNYRLTTRRLVQDWAVFNKKMRTLFLTDVDRVAVEKTPLEEMLGVGRIVIVPRDASQPPMIWRGVHSCGQVAKRIEAALSRAAPNLATVGSARTA